MDKKKIAKKGMLYAVIGMIVSTCILVWALYAQHNGHNHMDEYPPGYVPSDHTNFIIGSFIALIFFANAFIGERKDYKKAKSDQKKEFSNQNLQT